MFERLHKKGILFKKRQNFSGLHNCSREDAALDMLKDTQNHCPKTDIVLNQKQWLLGLLYKSIS